VSNKLPFVSSSIPRDLRAFLDRVRELVAGAGDDRLVTAGDLVSAGIAANGPGGALQPATPIAVYPTPPAPTGVTAVGAIQNIVISWDAPQYPGHAYAEVWVSDSNAFASAELLGMSPGSIYVHSVGPSSTRYYWVRFVNVLDVKGPYNAQQGVEGVTGADVTYLLQTLSGAITTSQLSQALNSRINLVDAPATTPGSVNARLSVVQSQVNELLNTPTYDNAEAYTVDDLVVYNGSIYRAKQATTGNLPTNTTYWELIGEFSSLGAAVAAHTSQIGALTTDLAAEASARTQLATAFNDPATGLAATRATLANDYYTKTAADSAISSAVTTLSSTVNNTLTGYVTTATLTNDYYTKTSADAAISQAVSGLASTTSVNDALGDYTTTADLTQNYYTKTQTDSAISSATSTLVSTTALDSALGNYTTTANLTQNYYTKTQTDSAISSATSTLVSTTALNNTLGNYTTTATLQQDYYTKTQADNAISSATSTLVSTVALNNALGSYTTTAALQQNYFTKAAGDGLSAQYTVKTDLAGRVAGFGLASEATLAGVGTSTFGVVADRFYIAAPNDFVQEGAPAGVSGRIWYKPSTKQTFRFDGSQWLAFEPIIPFVVQATPTTTGGVAVPAGVYINSAYIANGTITNAKIASAAIDDAKIVSLTASKLTAGSIAVDSFVQSSNYIAGTQGWAIHGNGAAEFSAAAIRGQLTASQIDTRGLTIKDAGGTVIFGAGTPLSTANISGLGTLATQNSVTTGQVTGLGTLATQNSVNWNSQITNIPAFGNFAYLSSITAANISTYIAGAAIGEAYIANGAITNAKIGTAAITSAKIGDAEVQTLKIAGNAVTVSAYVQLNSMLTITQVGDVAILSATVNTLGNPLLVVYSISFVIGNSAGAITNYPVEIRAGGTVVKTHTLIKPPSSGTSGTFEGVAYISNPPSGDISVAMYLNAGTMNNTIYFYPVTTSFSGPQALGTYFYTLGTKR
jgi:hypothetical protein